MEFIIKSDLAVTNAHIVPFQSENQDRKVINQNLHNFFEKVYQQNLARVTADFETRLDAEKRQAYQNGISVGLKQAETKYQKELKNSFTLFEEMASQFQETFTQIIETEEQNLLKLVLSIAKKVVATEIQTNPETILSVLKNALNLLNDRIGIKIYVNPQDWMVVKDNLNSLNLRIELPDSVEVINSVDMIQGGCRIESKSGSIDADIQTQFLEIERKILKDVD